MTVPNWITLLRIALVPPFVLLGLAGSPEAAVGSFVLFLGASLSDYLDGYLARRDERVTPLGEFLDPLADKLLVLAALGVLVVRRSFPLWAALVIAAREVAVQLLRARVVRAGGRMAASPAGKLKTTSQVWMVAWWLLPWPEPNPGHWLLLAAALVTTVWSGAGYALRARAGQEVGR